MTDEMLIRRLGSAAKAHLDVRSIECHDLAELLTEAKQRLAALTVAERCDLERTRITIGLRVDKHGHWAVFDTPTEYGLPSTKIADLDDEYRQYRIRVNLPALPYQELPGVMGVTRCK